MNSTSIPPATYPLRRYYFCQRFQTLIPTSLKQFYSNPRGPTCFPDFHAIRCSLYFFNLNSPHCTFYLISINAITAVIFNIPQLFHVLLPDFLSIIQNYFHRPTSIFKTTNPNNIFLLPKPLFGNSKQLATFMTRISFLHHLSIFSSIAIYTALLAPFFCVTIILPIFYFFFVILFSNPK